jgi:hypothetical protein
VEIGGGVSGGQVPFGLGGDQARNCEQTSQQAEVEGATLHENSCEVLK